jgi:hypothetical protein
MEHYETHWRTLTEIKAGHGETMAEIKVQAGILASRMCASEETLDKTDASVTLS